MGPGVRLESLTYAGIAPLPRWKLAADYAAYLVVRLVVCALQAISPTTCEQLARHGAWALWHVLRLRRRVIEENLAIAFPDSTPAQRAAIALEMWRHLLVMVAEVAHAPRKLHRTNWRDYSVIPDMAIMARRFLDRRPMVVLTGHLGNFEMGGYLLGLHGFPTHTVARRLDNPFLDRWINEFRGRTGQHMLEKTGSGPAIGELLASGGTLALLGDQYAGDGACWVNFFGKPAATHKAVGLFTLGGEAPTAVCASLRRERILQIQMTLGDLVDPADADCPVRTIPEVIQWYTGELEKLIRRAPGQYWWVHRRWKGTPPQRKRRAKKAA
ncbi:MAG: lipid A biosynthesis acyltransferase [Planctomycetaceae bacterium]|nr:lipid A biosynthesis acyltransferase [Planctomycetaceae bacterium]